MMLIRIKIKHTHYYFQKWFVIFQKNIKYVTLVFIYCFLHVHTIVSLVLLTLYWCSCNRSFLMCDVCAGCAAVCEWCVTPSTASMSVSHAPLPDEILIKYYCCWVAVSVVFACCQLVAAGRCMKLLFREILLPETLLFVWCKLNSHWLEICWLPSPWKQAVTWFVGWIQRSHLRQLHVSAYDGGRWKYWWCTGVWKIKMLNLDLATFNVLF